MARSNLPFVSSNIPPDLRQFLDRVRESLDGDTYVRRTDYIYGTVPRRPGEPSDPGDPGEPPTPPKPPCGDPVTPTAPTGFEVAAGFSGFLLSWQMPGYCGHDHTEVYALRRDGGASELTTANLLGTSQGVMYSHVVNQADDYWCFWIRHVNTAGVKGPFNDTPGTCARTAIPPEVLIEALKGKITESQLYKHLGERINLIDGASTIAGSVNERLKQASALLKSDINSAFGGIANGVTDIAIKTPTGFTTLQALSNTVIDPSTGLLAAHAMIGQINTVSATSTSAAARRIYSLEATVDTGDKTVSAYVAAQEDAWVNGDGALARRISGVEAIANNKNKVFVQATAPTASAVGDLWYDTSNSANVLIKRWTGSAWAVQRVDVKTYYQAAAPTGTLLIGDLWIDTDDQNRPYRWNGTQWVDVRDGYIVSYANSAVTNLESAKIGYCRNKTTKLTTEHGTRDDCVAAGHEWLVGLPWATAVKQVSVTYNGQSVALEQQFNAIASDVNGLEAQYTVKIDNNGYVSGFGLASTPVNEVPFSDFIIRADRFSIGAPANPDAGYQNDPSIPFIVTTTGQTLPDGTYVPPGTYIKAAYIQNGTITNAKIANATIDNAKIISLSVDKLTTGSLAVGQCISSQGFVSGSSGWQICASGDAEFNNILARGTLRSNNWNGALDSNNVIAANGTQGWVIDKNGNAEFDTIHLRKGAVSEMGWTAPVEGAGVSFSYPANVTQWLATATYQIGAVVWYQHRAKLYQCRVAHVNKAPPNLTYWSEYGYKTLATLVVPSDTFVNAPSGLGMMFYARTVFSAAVRYSLGSPLNRVVQKGSVSPYVPAGDVAVRLVRVAPNGAVTTYVGGGLALACCGRAESMTESGNLDWFYSLPFTSFEYVSTTPGTFRLEAKSMVLTDLVTIHAGGTALGFIGTKR